MHKIDEVTRDIERLQKLIARTGLKPETLMASASNGRTGRGGPFIPLRGGDRKPSELDEALAILYGHIDHWDGLQQVIRRLPLSSPAPFVWSINSPHTSDKDSLIAPDW